VNMLDEFSLSGFHQGKESLVFRKDFYFHVSPCAKWQLIAQKI
jgi:hypothetical protein